MKIVLHYSLGHLVVALLIAKMKKEGKNYFDEMLCSLLICFIYNEL